MGLPVRASADAMSTQGVAQRHHARMRGAGAMGGPCSAWGALSRGSPPGSVFHALPLQRGPEVGLGRGCSILRSISSLESPSKSSPMAARSALEGGAAEVLLGKRPASAA